MSEASAAPATQKPGTPPMPPLDLAKEGDKKDGTDKKEITPPKEEKKPAVDLQPPPSRTEAKDFAAQFLLGELIKAATMELRGMNGPWSKLSQYQQESVLARVKQRAEAAVKEAVDVIASTARLTFRAECESVTFKDGVKAALKMAKTEDAHVLADQSGKTVLIVIEDYARFMNPGDATKGESDQRALFDKSKDEERTAADKPRRPPPKKKVKSAGTPKRKGRGK